MQRELCCKDFFRLFTTMTLFLVIHLKKKNELKSLDSKVFNIANKNFNIGISKPNSVKCV